MATSVEIEQAIAACQTNLELVKRFNIEWHHRMDQMDETTKAYFERLRASNSSKLEELQQQLLWTHRYEALVDLHRSNDPERWGRFVDYYRSSMLAHPVVTSASLQRLSDGAHLLSETELRDVVDFAVRHRLSYDETTVEFCGEWTDAIRGEWVRRFGLWLNHSEQRRYHRQMFVFRPIRRLTTTALEDIAEGDYQNYMPEEHYRWLVQNHFVSL